MGIHHHDRWELASADMAIAHVGLPDFRLATWMAPFGQRFIPRRKRDPSVYSRSSNDWRGLAKCVSRRSFRCSSRPC